MRAASNGSGGGVVVGGGGGCNSGGEHDALSDSLSHQSVQSASLWTAAAPVNGGNCSGTDADVLLLIDSFFQVVQVPSIWFIRDRP